MFASSFVWTRSASFIFIIVDSVISNRNRSIRYKKMSLCSLLRAKGSLLIVPRIVNAVCVECLNISTVASYGVVKGVAVRDELFVALRLAVEEAIEVATEKALGLLILGVTNAGGIGLRSSLSSISSSEPV